MLARMHAELDRLGAIDLDTLGDDELHDVVVGQPAVMARLAGFGARCTAAWEGRRVWANDGSKSPVARLAHDAHLSHREARLAVTRARRLRHMPATADALCAGTVTAGHADALASVVNPERANVFIRDEELLIDHARTLSFPDFRRALTYWTQRADGCGVEAEALRIRDGRYVDAARTFAGTVDLRGELDPVDGTIVLDELERLEQIEFERDWRVARATHGERATADQLARTPRQRRADALVTMARRSAAMPADHVPARPLITVLVDYPSLAGPVRELADGTVLSPGQILPLLTEADIERVVFDGPSRVLDVGVRRRLFTGATRRAIEVRDRHCSHPGCHEPAHRCHVDHIQPWSQGGLTTQQNGRLLCPVHNRSRADQPDHADARGP